MTTLVAGASGATGRLLVEQLLERGEKVRAVVRDAARLPAALAGHDGLSVTEAALLDLDDAALARLVDGCGAVASCLGHNPGIGGIFGPPRRLVTDATRRLCAAIRANRPAAPLRFVLMSSSGVRDPRTDRPLGPADRAVLALLRLLLPPQVDNEQAAGYLRVQVGGNDPAIDWVAVRPENLFDAGAVSAYDAQPAPIRGVVFDAGATSRDNVAHFIAELITDDACWARWRGRMPVIYNRD